MLKNKEERKSFLLNKDNWTQSFDLSEIGMVISHLILPDGMFILKFDVKEERIDDYNYRGVHEVTKYRILISYGEHVSDEVSMTFLIDLLGRIK